MSDQQSTKTRRVFGIRNTAYFNTRAEGDVEFFGDRADRDTALAALRDEAIAKGLSQPAVRAGIVPVILSATALGEGYEGDLSAWLERYTECEDRPSDQATMLDEVGL